MNRFLDAFLLFWFFLTSGFHFEAEEFSELIVGNDSLVDYVRNFTEIWYSNYSLTMCMDDLLAARERAHDPFKLGRFCDEMDAFRLYTGEKVFFVFVFLSVVFSFQKSKR